MGKLEKFQAKLVTDRLSCKTYTVESAEVTLNDQLFLLFLCKASIVHSLPFFQIA